VTALAFSPDSRLLLSGSWDQTVRLWDVTTGKELNRLVGHTSRVDAVAFAPDGKLAASAGWDKTLRLWDIESGKEIRVLNGHTGEVSGVALTLLSGGGMAGSS
jgi:WD40 repeat protein